PSDIERLIQALPADDVQVVITARNLVRVVPSHWQSKIRDGWPTPWTVFANAVCQDPSVAGADGGGVLRVPDGDETMHEWFWRRHDLAGISARWTQQLPTASVTVVTVPTSRQLGDVLAQRFGEVVGVDMSGLTQPQGSNPSLGAHSAELLRRL